MRVRLTVLGPLAAATTLLTLTGLLPATAAPTAEPDRDARPPLTERVTVAREALYDASDALRRGVDNIDGRGLTLVLRDLAATAGDLPSARQRAEARAILARPTSTYEFPGPGEIEGDPRYGAAESDVRCGDHICVHWVETGRHAVEGSDGNLATVPASVYRARDDLDLVYEQEVEVRGYRAPVSDIDAEDNGGTSAPDFYLADIGEAGGNGPFGFCASDQPGLAASDPTIYGYCVLDNDYDPSEYPNDNTPLENAQVTGAHEFFHLVQYAYDWLEDPWLMEGTAAWMEDEVFDDVDDNVSYLQVSQLRFPWVPLDFANTTSGTQYGAWIWWRYLAESTGDPSIIRQIWYRARTEETFSLRAVEQEMFQRGTTFPGAYAGFGTWMRNPARFFDEGDENDYPRSLLTGNIELTNSQRSTGLLQINDRRHMTHDFVRFTPDSSLTGSWRAVVRVNLPDLGTRPRARVIVYRTDGSQATRVIALDANGDGSRVVNFTRSATRFIELDLVNASASTRFFCYEGTFLTCQGRSIDDRRSAIFSVTAAR